jgi:hypothetical protein
MKKGAFMERNHVGIASHTMTTIILLSASLFTAAQAGKANPPEQTPNPWKSVEEAMGRPGQMQPGEVIKFGLPRKDLHVTLDGVDIKAALALGSWVAFKKDGGSSMVMGDLVLTQDEVEPVMLKLQEGGIEQSALHNHLLGETPHVMYMHIEGHGDPAQMAKVIHDAVALTKTPGPDASSAPRRPPTWASIRSRSSRFLGTPGKSMAEFFRSEFRDRKRSPIRA